MQFAGLMASLRAPRVAVVVPADGWELHSLRAIEFFSRTWGGASGVVIPTNQGEVDAAVSRLLRRYDPDYATTLRSSLGDAERLHPGKVPITVDGELLEGHARLDFIARAEANGPQLMNPVVDEEVLDAVSAELSCFRDDDGYRRIVSVHPSEDPPNPLAVVDTDAADQVLLETGDELVDLALAMRNGRPVSPTEVRSLADGSLRLREACAILTRDDSFRVGAPFDSTRVGLASINYGFLGDQDLVVVLGRTVDDMALAMLWDRLVGSGVWLPFTGSHRTWHPWLGSALDWGRLRAHRKIVVTSTSWTEARCIAFMRRLWAARVVRDPSDMSEPWEYTPPSALDNQGRVDLRLNDRWDERFAVPINVYEDGAAAMATTYPLLAPDRFPAGPRGWVIDTEWPEHPVHSHKAVQGSDLMSASQDRYETFVRASGKSISFESGRFDFVASGASKFGQLAQPRLRWPGLLNTLQIAAGSNGYTVQPSHAGRVGRITADLWRGRQDLADDLAGDRRELVKAFTTTRTSNGPIDKGEGVTDSNSRLMFSGNCLVPFAALERLVGAQILKADIRSWLDTRIETGAIRMGLALECGFCPWLDYYRIDEVGTHFDCKRCGSKNAVAHERWRSPPDEPRWYYNLHPTVVQFLKDNGDVPILAVHQFAASRRAFDAEFEVEIVKDSESRPTMEIDFAFMSRDGLVLGEAKSVSRLDGKDEKERLRDVGKLIEAARILGAREICFASTKVWGQLAIDSIARAVTASKTGVAVSLLEKLGTAEPSARKVIHNLAGP